MGLGGDLEVLQQLLRDVACVDADLDGSVEFGHKFSSCFSPAPPQVLLREEKLERETQSRLSKEIPPGPSYPDPGLRTHRHPGPSPGQPGRTSRRGGGHAE